MHHTRSCQLTVLLPRPARNTSGSGSLKAPGLHEVTKGRETGSTIPTAAFLSIKAQTELAELGIVGLGSGRNTDMVALSAIPTLRGEKVVMRLFEAATIAAGSMEIQLNNVARFGLGLPKGS